MKNLFDVLTQQISEQISLEEHLCTVIQQQISDLDKSDHPEALDVLVKAKDALERHLVPLNSMLDQLDQRAAGDRSLPAGGNGVAFSNLICQENKQKLSKMLRDDYGALNIITMSNTLLHTTALALDCGEIAATALSHLRNLAPLVVKIGEMVPEVIARELHSESPNIDLSVARTALRNTQMAWGHKP